MSGMWALDLETSVEKEIMNCDCTATAEIVHNGERFCPFLWTPQNHRRLQKIEDGHLLTAYSDSGLIKWSHDCAAESCGKYEFVSDGNADYLKEKLKTN